MPDRYYLQGPKAGLPVGLFPGKFVFDANVWLSISGPFEDSVRQRAIAYSSFYKKAVNSKSTVIIPQIVACEFLNRAVWILAQADGFERGQGKLHRDPKYAHWIKESCDLLHSVVSDNIRVSDEFESIELETCYANAEKGGLEFHDVLIANTCVRNGWILVTDDSDYSGQDVPVVTWNQRLT
jgi:predicted nucleic acid-binding protein